MRNWNRSLSFLVCTVVVHAALFVVTGSATTFFENFDTTGNWSGGSMTAYTIDKQYATPGSPVVFACTNEALRDTVAVQDSFTRTHTNSTYSWRIRDQGVGDWKATIATGGVSTFSFYVRRWDATPDVNYTCDVSVNNGSSYTNHLTINGAWLGTSSDWKQINGAINTVNGPGSADDIIIRLHRVSGERLLVDSFELTDLSGGPASNQPPALAAISDVNVAESNSVIFLVHATNVDAADDVTLWATNLPPGAVFDPTNALGAVSNLFSWTSASPTGTYVSTFFAADKDGTNSDSVTFTVYPAGIASDLIISEYGHSSGNNKFIEIYNGLSIPVNLSSYAIRLQRNGATNVGGFEGSFALSGTLAPNRTFVIVHSLAASALLKSKANLLSSTSPMDFSGNDPVQLLKLGNPVDIVGPLSDFSNWGQNQILRRKSYVLSPSTNYIPADWDQISQTDWSNVGLHTMDGQPAQSGYPPTLDPISPQIVTVGSDLQFNVTALDALDGDLITLSATSLPAGALFPTVTNAASVTGTLIWSNTTPVGVYTSSFAAVDQHGTNTLAVQITVTPIFPSNQSIIVHFNEVRFNDSGDTNAVDNKEFVELIGHAGTNLAGCVLIHCTGTAGTDADVWTYTFPSFVIPDDGILDTNGHALGFVVLAQPDGLIAGSADLLLPSIGATVPRPSLQNNVQGLVLYDPSGKALDAVAWGSFGTPGDTGDLLIDDPGPNFITQTGSPQQPHYLHQMPYSSDDNTPQAPDNVIGDSGANWQVLNATPGALNNIQTSGNIILEPFVLIVPPPTGLLILVR